MGRTSFPISSLSVTVVLAFNILIISKNNGIDGEFKVQFPTISMFLNHLEDFKVRINICDCSVLFGSASR